MNCKICIPKTKQLTPLQLCNVFKNIARWVFQRPNNCNVFKTFSPPALSCLAVLLCNLFKNVCLHQLCWHHIVHLTSDTALTSFIPHLPFREQMIWTNPKFNPPESHQWFWMFCQFVSSLCHRSLFRGQIYCKMWIIKFVVSLKWFSTWKSNWPSK